MQITAELAEIVRPLQEAGLIPAAVTEISATPGKLTAKVKVHELPGVAPAIAMAARMVGPVDVTVTSELQPQTLTVVINAAARGLNLSEQVAPVLEEKLAVLPAGLVRVFAAGGRTLVEVNLPAVVRHYRFHVKRVELGQTVVVEGQLQFS